MSDWVNFAIGGAIIALTGTATLPGVWIGVAGEANTIGMAAIAASIVGVGFLVAALGIQIPESTAGRPTKVQGRNDE
jgi:hypothetical protein